MVEDASVLRRSEALQVVEVVEVVESVEMRMCKE